MNLNLGGKVVIITGAARGIGRETALTFAREGANVIVSDIDLTAADGVAQETRTLGCQAVALKADVTNPTEVQHMVKEVLDEFKRLDILVNNAGLPYVEGKPQDHKHSFFIELTEEDWHRNIDVTLFGVLNCTKAVIKPMIEQKSGVIVNIASDAGRGPTVGSTVGVSVYGAGKGGVIAFTRQLAYEVARYGIRVNCISPGLINTTRLTAMYKARVQEEKDLLVVKVPESIREMVKLTPLGRVGTPQEIANVVVFLASDASSFITGQTLSVNGGALMP